MELSKVLLLTLIFSMIFSVASASDINIVSPVNNYHYENQNVLLNVSNLNAENKTTCEFIINLDTSLNVEIENQTHYAYYMGSLNPTNTLEYNCSFSESEYNEGDVVFYVTEQTEDNSYMEIFIFLFLIIIVGMFIFLIFKY